MSVMVKRKSGRPRCSRATDSEALLVRAVLEAAALYGIPCYRMNSGATVYEDGNSGRRRLVRYGFPGCPDLMLLMRDGYTLWVECKSEKGTLTPAQAEFSRLCRKLGVPHIVVRSLDDILPYIRRGSIK